LLLKAKADTNLKDQYGKTPLHYAVEDSKKNIVGLLVKKFARCDLNMVDNNGFPALFYAAENGAHEVVKLLIESRKCNLNFTDEEHGCTALHKAAFFGNKSVVTLLLESNCKIQPDRRGISPIDVAKEFNETKIERLLELYKKKNTNKKS